MSAAPGLARVAARLRERGLEVVELAGWQDRGRGELRPTGHTQHHTGGLTTAECVLRGIDPDTPSLRVCTFGREGLRNALCNFYVSRIGVIYLVAGRVAWHAGAGVLGTNSTLIGTEAEHSGGPYEPWTLGSLQSQLAIAVECAREFDYPITPGVHDHREHAPKRKPDRINIDSDTFRDQVLAGLHASLAAIIEGDDVDKLRLLQDANTTRVYLCHDDRLERRYVRTAEAVRFFEDVVGVHPNMRVDPSVVEVYVLVENV